MKSNQKISKRDVIFSITLFVVIGFVYLLFYLLAFSNEASSAHIYYGLSKDPIVSIYFDSELVVINREQEGSEGSQIYPMVDEENKTITLLGDYRIQGERQIVVIKYNFERKSVKIIEEQSPNNICSRQGESTGLPVICLPNRIRIEFSTSDDDYDFRL